MSALVINQYNMGFVHITQLLALSRACHSTNACAPVCQIGVGGYNFDSHNVQRLPCASDTLHCEPTNSSGGDSDGVQGAYALDEGDLEVWPGYFEIPHTVLLPDATQASNLAVSVAVSASHVGYSSLRLEPQVRGDMMTCSCHAHVTLPVHDTVLLLLLLSLVYHST